MAVVMMGMILGMVLPIGAILIWLMGGTTMVDPLWRLLWWVALRIVIVEGGTAKGVAAGVLRVLVLAAGPAMAAIGSTAGDTGGAMPEIPVQVPAPVPAGLWSCRGCPQPSDHVRRRCGARAWRGDKCVRSEWRRTHWLLRR